MKHRHSAGLLRPSIYKISLKTVGSRLLPTNKHVNAFGHWREQVITYLTHVMQPEITSLPIRASYVFLRTIRILVVVRILRINLNRLGWKLTDIQKLSLILLLQK